MPALIAVIIVIVIVYYFWRYLLAILLAAGALWAVYAFLKKMSEDEAAREALREQERQARERERQAREAAAQQHRAQQLSYRNELERICEASIASFESIPKHLLNTEELLDVAEQDYNENAFAPFWDTIERALARLSQLDQSVNTITSGLQRYAEVTKLYEGSSSPFPVKVESVRRVTDANETTKRLQGIVRTAQRNFQFATIYEQRKTNQLLIAGFTNLAQALDGLGMRIVSSIERLESTVERSYREMTESIIESHRELSDSITSSISALDSNLQTTFSEQSKRETQALEMLDNIQRRRMPHDSKLGDGSY